ncbi:5-carboxyvanillate decarboxylase [Oscillospiraceae bacterium]|nr:5-carboxyvanillate decarboxylase [Oscillospiraceae bacterium]BDF75574.1 5-carboxyvanillate decarboxylase [Oscillospiraceae bacterium]
MAERRIDLQAHFMPQSYIRALLDRPGPPTIRREGGAYRFQYGPDSSYLITRASLDIAELLEQMDHNGIELEVLSINLPGAELLDEAGGIALARAVNDEFASIIKSYPGRFSALATLCYRNVDQALCEMERCHKLGFAGAMLFSNVMGLYLDDKRLWPLYERAQRLDIPLYLHPTTPLIAPHVRDYGLEGMLGYVYDTSLAALRLILSGVFDAYPRLKLVVPHAGGVLPWLAARIDHQSRLIPGAARHISALPSQYIARLYLDTVCLSADNLRFALQMVGPEHLLFATDYPFVPMEATIDTIDRLHLPPEQRKLLFSGNAEQLFHL